MSLPGPVLAIVGPTASGKSALAELLACTLHSSVVSVDAMQVYRGMDIGTAKVPEAERRCPLLMVDVADIGDEYSVKLFQQDARRCVDTLLDEGKVPILCGGTGLYLDAIIDEMQFPAGSSGDERRSTYERLLERAGAQHLYELLVARDPESAQLIHPNNTRRVIRALEMLDEGSSYARHHEGLKRLEPHYEARIWGITYERAALYQRIDRRVDEMFERGLVDEVECLRMRGLSRTRTASQAIGYKEVLAALEGQTSMDEARELVKRRTRNYAKRQLSWLRRDGRVRWVDAGDLEQAAREILVDLAQATD